MSAIVPISAIVTSGQSWLMVEIHKSEGVGDTDWVQFMDESDTQKRLVVAADKDIFLSRYNVMDGVRVEQGNPFKALADG